MLLYQTFTFIIHSKNTKQSYKNNKLKYQSQHGMKNLVTGQPFNNDICL